MGSRSKTVQQSTETNIQDIDTTNIDLEVVDGVGVADVGGDVQIIVSDQGAIDAGRDIALSGLDEAFAFGGDTVDEAFGFGESAFAFAQGISDKAIDTLGGAITKVSEASRSDAANSFNMLIKFGSIAAGVLGLAFIVTRARG